jgi:hypothetical protein
MIWLTGLIEVMGADGSYAPCGIRSDRDAEGKSGWVAAPVQSPAALT